MRTTRDEITALTKDGKERRVFEEIDALKTKDTEFTAELDGIKESIKSTDAAVESLSSEISKVNHPVIYKHQFHVQFSVLERPAGELWFHFYDSYSEIYKSWDEIQEHLRGGLECTGWIQTNLSLSTAVDEPQFINVCLIQYPGGDSTMFYHKTDVADFGGKHPRVFSVYDTLQNERFIPFITKFGETKTKITL